MLIYYIKYKTNSLRTRTNEMVRKKHVVEGGKQEVDAGTVSEEVGS